MLVFTVQRDEPVWLVLNGDTLGHIRIVRGGPRSEGLRLGFELRPEVHVIRDQRGRPAKDPSQLSLRNLWE